MLKINLFVISLVFVLGIVFIFLFSIKAEGDEETSYCLKRTYSFYKKEFLSNDGRVMDPEKNYITTSEGQAYMLLRAVVIGDKKTFDLVYQWAINNLHRQDNLFAWLWGENENGEYKILDYNSASDADVDIAFALLLAYEKWKNPEYLEDAQVIMNSIWNNETKYIGEYLVLMPGVNQTLSERTELNPSYFSPFAFRFFQKYDQLHNWGYLIDSSYYYLTEVMSKTATNLPPDWFLITACPGECQIELEGDRSDFSYDAVRVFARVYLDYLNTGEKRALPILEKVKFFIEKWNVEHVLYVNYKSNGELKDKNKPIGSIGLLVPIIGFYDKKTAREIYDKEIVPYFYNEKNWNPKNDYYGKNLLWFGCYLYNQNFK